jgi:glycosyltransferase involved in cell wall biosynthesis
MNIKPIVLIPVYTCELTYEELYSLDRTINLLSKYEIHIISPNKLRCADDFSNYKHVAVDYFPDSYFDSINGYNKLLTSLFFYEIYRNFSHILIVQLDAIIISDQLAKWCEEDYSYVGAPFFTGLSKPEIFDEMIGTGNGGLSLRRVNDFIAVLKHFRYLPNNLYQKNKKFYRRLVAKTLDRYIFCTNKRPFFPYVSEDIFWGMIAPVNVPGFKVPPPSISLRFSFDAGPSRLYETNNHNLPFGCHAWERYEKDFWLELIDVYKDYMTNRQSLSIITAVRNNIQGMIKTIDSIRRIKSCVNRFFIEWIVIDSCSTDGTQELIKNNLDIIDKHIIEKDSGIYDGMNKGIKIAEGEFLFFLNSGDIVEYSLDLDNLFPLSKRNVYVFDVQTHRDDLYFPKFRVSPYLMRMPCHQAMIVPRIVKGTVYYYDTSYKINSDLDYKLRLYKKLNFTFHEEILIARLEKWGASQRYDNWFSPFKIASRETKLAYAHNGIVSAFINFAVRIPWHSIKLIRSIFISRKGNFTEGRR